MLVVKRKLRRLSSVRSHDLTKAAGTNSGGLFLCQVVFVIAVHHTVGENVEVRGVVLQCITTGSVVPFSNTLSPLPRNRAFDSSLRCDFAMTAV